MVRHMIDHLSWEDDKVEGEEGKESTYVYINTYKDSDLLHDRPILPEDATDKQNHHCLDYSQYLVMSPRGA